MEISEFKVGCEFKLGEKTFRCTDIGSRVVIGIPLRANVATTSAPDDLKLLSVEETASQGWLNGPPYALAELVFDEDDLDQCEPA